MSTALRTPPRPLRTAPRDDVLFEVVDGQIVELKPKSAKEVRLSNILAGFIWGQIPSPWPGEVFVEILFAQMKKKGKRDRRPDLAYVAYGDQWPSRQVPEEDAWPMVPGLAAEIVSKSNTARHIRGKIEDYFKAGVRLVWVIYPERHLIDVYSGLDSAQTLRAKDTLTGGEVMPWFSLPLKTLFAYYPKPADEE